MVETVKKPNCPRKGCPGVMEFAETFRLKATGVVVEKYQCTVCFGRAWERLYKPEQVEGTSNE